MAYFPTLEEVKTLRYKGNLVPIYRKIQADLETPVSAFLKVAESPYSFLLESVFVLSQNTGRRSHEKG